MEGLEEKLGAILKDPDSMQKIMSMAKSLGAGQESQGSGLPELDPAMLQRVAAISKQGSIDKNQQALLRALTPYLSRQRITKLENAMRAAKMAGFAASALSTGNSQGR